MAENNNSKLEKSYEDYYDRKLYEVCYQFVEESLELGVNLEDLKTILLRTKSVSTKVKDEEDSSGLHLKWRHFIVIGIVLFIGILCSDEQPLDDLSRMFFNSKCILQNNFFVMEVSRPINNCSMCEGVQSVVLLSNTSTQETFAKYAYSGQPVLVKGAAASWSAINTFSFDFFKRIYEEVRGAYESVEEECQFFPFRTDFVRLKDVFAMSPERARGMGSEKTWYVGWSNCHPEIAAIFRQHYSRPHFLPINSESSAIDWIFMGWPGLGASIHLDYVQRPSWQAQISGEKLWRLFPLPECEHVCSGFNITVQKGDVVLIDTNRWYHDTYIDHGEISITIGSEYD